MNKQQLLNYLIRVESDLREAVDSSTEIDFSDYLLLGSVYRTIADIVDELKRSE